MFFGLKNVSATYQRLVNKIFTEEIEKFIEVYVDDIIVKGPSFEAHIKDLERAFEIFKEYKMKLILEKCTFGVEARKFLDFMIFKRGIKANS